MDEETKKCTCGCGSECAEGKCVACGEDCECGDAANEEAPAEEEVM